MPRTGRLHIPGGFYHVAGRGLERRYIFDDVVDKQDFLARFGKSLLRVDARCLAWALMSNHYHFLIQAGNKPLSKLMASVLGGFAGSYNRRHDRAGYVFQNRFKSILIDADSYLLELVRYIHLNPVRAGMVAGAKELERYRWAGHAGMMGKYKQGWHRASQALGYFGEDTRRAKNNYLRFLKDAKNKSSSINIAGGGLIRSHGGWENVKELRKEHIYCIGDERILGSSDFVENVLRFDDLGIDRREGLARKGWNLEKLALSICDQTGVTQEQLRSKARKGSLSEAKSMFCYLGSVELGFSLREVADYLFISQPSVSAWVKKGNLLCRTKGISIAAIDC